MDNFFSAHHHSIDAITLLDSSFLGMKTTKEIVVAGKDNWAPKGMLLATLIAANRFAIGNEWFNEYVLFPGLVVTILVWRITDIAHFTMVSAIADAKLANLTVEDIDNSTSTGSGGYHRDEDGVMRKNKD